MIKSLGSKRILTISSLFLALLLFGFQSTSHATLVLRVTDPGSGTTITITDGGSNDPDGLTNGVVNLADFSFSANWAISVDTGVSYYNPIQGIDLNSISMSSVNGGTLILNLSDSGFTTTGSYSFVVGGTVGGTTSGTNTATFGADVNGTQVAVLGPYNNTNLTPLAFSGTQEGAFNPVTAYSLDITATVTHVGAATTSFNASLSTVPLPGGFMLMGAGLIRLVAYARRREI